MKIVITGAAGHIGSYLIRDLAYQFPTSEIIMIDNFITQRYASLFNLPNIGTFRFIEADITKIDLVSIFDSADFVVHLAAITDAASSFNNAFAVEENNYNSTVKVSEACCQTGSKLIAISSTSVYGVQSEIVSEDTAEENLSPQSPYALTKLKEEKYINNLYNTRGLKAIICRFGTIYGVSPGMRFHTAVNKFCWQACMGLPITVWTTALDQKRPYLDLSDASRAIRFIMQNQLFDGEIYNVLTNNSTVRDVVDIISSLLPDVKISLVDHEIMNQLSYEVLNSKFKSHGFYFTGDINVGISNTISLIKRANR